MLDVDDLIEYTTELTDYALNQKDILHNIACDEEDRQIAVDGLLWDIPSIVDLYATIRGMLKQFDDENVAIDSIEEVFNSGKTNYQVQKDISNQSMSELGTVLNQLGKLVSHIKSIRKGFCKIHSIADTLLADEVNLEEANKDTIIATARLNSLINKSTY